MTIPVAIATSLIAGGAAFLIAFVGALLNINVKLGRLDESRANLREGQLKLEQGQEKLEQGQQRLETEIRATRDSFDVQLAVSEERALAREKAAEERAIVREKAAEERAIAREAVAEERALAREAVAEERALAREMAALARHNELLAEIRLWRTHGHDADGNIFFRVPE